MSRDFVEFINSEDVKKYVRETGYQLSSQEAAFVVWQSKNTPLEERFAAWKEIIETMPDSSFVGYGNFNFEKWKMEPAPVYGLHDFLRQYIQRQKELLAAFTREGDGTYTLEKREGPWVGGEINDWFYSAVSFVYENGLFSGTAADTFSPNMNITRGMVVTVLYQLAGRPAVSGDSGFSDVAPDAYYALPVAWASANGVVAGMGNNEFPPNSTITREQLACMLYSYARSIAGADVSARGDLTQYVDFSQVSSYAQEALSWAVGAWFITGMDAQTLSPGGTATRAQAAAMLQVLSSLL